MKLGYVDEQQPQKIDKIIFTKYDIKEPIKLCPKHNKCSENGCNEKIYCLLQCGHFLCETHFNNFLEKKVIRLKRHSFVKIAIKYYVVYVRKERITTFWLG